MKPLIILIHLLISTVLLSQEISRKHVFQINSIESNKQDFYGKSVAINDNFYFISASSFNGLNLDGGIVFVYDRKTNKLVQRLPEIITPSEKAHFGFSISANNNFLVIGSDQEIGKKATNAGKVYIYQFNKENNQWILMTELHGDGGKNKNGFGKQIAIDESNRILITEDSFDSYGSDDNYYDQAKEYSSDGKAYVYSLDKYREWHREKGELTYFNYNKIKPNESEGFKQRMGQESGDINGNYIAIGARWYKKGIKKIGSVNIFRKDSSNVWKKWQRITVKNQTSKCCKNKYDVCHTGAAVKLDDDLLAFSVKASTVNGIKKAGQVYIFRRKAGKYIQEFVIEEPKPAEYAYFGSKLFLKNGVLLISSLKDGGVVYVYYEKDKKWHLKKIIKQKQTYKFGKSISLYSNSLLIGSEHNYFGRVYLYEFNK